MEEGELAMEEDGLVMVEGEGRRVRKGSAHVQVGTDRLDLWRPVHAAIWVRVVQAYVVDVHAHFLAMNPAKKLIRAFFTKCVKGGKGRWREIGTHFFRLTSAISDSIRSHPPTLVGSLALSLL